MDEQSMKILPTAASGAWDRNLHAILLEKLTTDGARAVVFDIVFDGPGSANASDGHLMRAIKANGHVILAAVAQTDPYQAGSLRRRIARSSLLSLAHGCGGLGNRECQAWH